MKKTICYAGTVAVKFDNPYADLQLHKRPEKDTRVASTFVFVLKTKIALFVRLKNIA
jgi:hypothetical protein